MGDGKRGRIEGGRERAGVEGETKTGIGSTREREQARRQEDRGRNRKKTRQRLSERNTAPQKDSTGKKTASGEREGGREGGREKDRVGGRLCQTKYPTEKKNRTVTNRDKHTNWRKLE